MTEKFMGEAMLTANVFDDSFEPISYFADEQKRLGSMELLIRRGGRSYVMSVESYPTHIERSAIDESTEEDAMEQTYVIAGEEIFPSDLASLKQKSLEELAPFLVEQV